MKLILALLTGAALLTSAANVQAARPEPGRLPQGFGPSYPNEAFPSGIPYARPNEPRAYGETFSGRRVNPDRVPPLSPGGQGVAASSR